MNEVEFNISNSELVVMRVIWSLGEARVDEIETQVAEREVWSTATIKTLLGRLVKKGILTTEKEGRKFVYKPLMEECTAINLMAENLLDKVCETKQTNLLSDMIALSNLTAEDVAKLQEELANKEVVKSANCNCIKDFKVCSCKHEHEMSA